MNNRKPIPVFRSGTEFPDALVCSRSAVRQLEQDFNEAILQLIEYARHEEFRKYYGKEARSIALRDTIKFLEEQTGLTYEQLKAKGE